MAPRLTPTRLALLGAAGAAAAMARRRARANGTTSSGVTPASTGSNAVTDALSSSRLSRTGELAKVGVSAGAGYVTHQARRALADGERKAELDAAYELRTAEQVAATLGNMKGVLMKLGQMASFVNEGFPEAMREQLAQLQADAPPMHPDLAAEMVTRELGGEPDRVFAEWDPHPLASASIGQVHRARLHDGTPVAVKVQYPGVEKAIAADLDNTAMLTGILGFVFKGLDTGPFVTELRARIGEELDYTLEARRQLRFADLYRGHPAIVIPDVHLGYSTARVLTTTLSPGERFAATEHWSQHERDLAGEIIYRFVFRSFNRHRLFNGDPHPGNYLLEREGPFGVRVTFLDFGLVKEFTQQELDTFWRMIRYQVTERDPVAYRATVEEAGLLVPGAPYSTEELMDYFGYFYNPVLEHRRFTYTKQYAREALKRTFDPAGPHTEMMKWFNLPPSFVVLNRIQWGLNAVLASLDATADWRSISDELWPWVDAAPSTPLGAAEAAWLAARAGA